MVLPEREPCPGAYAGLAGLLASLDEPAWPSLYVHWELGLLAALGFGLDLSRCTVTGANDALAYVSPRTGRAVSLSAGEAWRDRLLRLPGFLVGQGDAGPQEVLEGLALTGHFLERHVFAQKGRAAPAARSRFVDRLRKMAPAAGPGLLQHRHERSGP